VRREGQMPLVFSAVLSRLLRTFLLSLSLWAPGGIESDAA